MIHNQTSGFYCYPYTLSVHIMCMYMYTAHLIRKLISCRIVRDFLIICNSSPNLQARRPGFQRGGYPTRYDFAKVLFPPRPRLPPETNLIRNFRTSGNFKRHALSFSLLFVPHSLHKVCYFSLACCENIVLWCVYGTHSTQR